MRVTILGFTIQPEELDRIIQTDQEMPIQTHAFAWGLVESLQSAGISVTLLSAAPVSNYPRNSRIIFRGEPFTAAGVNGRSLGFLNLIILKHATRFVSCLWHGTRAYRRWRPNVLLIHGVHSPYLAYGLLLRLISPARTVVVATDPPGLVVPSDGALAKMLKAIDRRAVRLALGSMDGIIALTAPLVADFAPNVPSLVLEGIVHVTGTSELAVEKHEGCRVIYAGGLQSAYGVDRLVTAVRRMPDMNVRLSVFGKGPLSSWIDEQAIADVHIDPTQFVSRVDVQAQYRMADLLIQPRPVGQGFVRYSFPSKLLEYMSSGTPVLSTRLSEIPAEYEPFIYWIDDDSPEGIEDALRGVLALSVEERLAKGRAGAEFVRNSRSSEAQGVRIRAFLQRLVAREEPGTPASRWIRPTRSS